MNERRYPVIPKGSIKPPRTWAFKELESTPAPADTEPIALRASLRDAYREINRLGLVVAEKDAVIAHLAKNLEEARK